MLLEMKLSSYAADFLAQIEMSAEAFEEFTRESPKKALFLLTEFRRLQIADYGDEWSGSEWADSNIKKIRAYASPAEEPGKACPNDEKVTVNLAPAIIEAEEKSDQPSAGSEKADASDAVEVETEVIEPDIVSAPKVEAGDMGFHAVRQALSVTCQKVVSKDVASVVHDAMGGRMALPPLFFSGFAGLGKTFTVSLIADLLPKHRLIELPPGFSATAFKKALVDFHHEPFIMFLDEFHDMDAGIRNMLKSITETNGKVKEFTLSISGNDHKITIDPRKHWFIGASNEPIKDSALVGQSGRFRDCQFLPYDEKGKMGILNALSGQYLPGVELSTPVKSIVCRNCRPFARSLKMMLERLWTEKKAGADLTTEEGVKKAIAAAGYFPEGWRKEHTDVLTFLAATEQGRQVQEIAAGPMRGASTKQATALLSELMQGDLIMTLGNGRKAATAAAVKLLKKLEKKA